MRLAAASALVAFAALLFFAQDGVHAGAFPGLNGRIAFASARDQNLEIYTVAPDGSAAQRLTRDPLSTDIDPSWSPDGKRIAFTSNRSGNDDIYVMAADGSGQTRLTTDPSSDVNPSWSPGGRNIAFASSRDGDSEIFVMNEDGSGQAQLTRNDGAPDAVPAWSPDGNRIAFTSWRDGNSNIWVMNVDGSNQTRLTADPGEDYGPSWSPDGTTIAFTSNRDGNYEIYAMNADGGNQTRLTRNLETDLDPAWSPDGTKIAFTSNRDVNREIYTMSADGSLPTRVTASAGDDTTADWQPVPLLPRVVERAFFRGRWRESRYLGVFVIEGRTPGPVRLDLVLRRRQRVYLQRTLTLAAGRFERAFALPGDILPGAYVLDVTPRASPTEVAAQQLLPPLPAPLEGVVSRAWASTTIGGPPLGTLPPTSDAFAHFRFAVLPRPGRALVARWYWKGRLQGQPRRKQRSKLVIAGVYVQDALLPRGAYACVLRAGGTVVKRVTFRIA